jgi:hypothetical protein
MTTFLSTCARAHVLLLASVCACLRLSQTVKHEAQPRGLCKRCEALFHHGTPHLVRK